MTHKELYLEGKMPECFNPCPPFYDMCNRGMAILNREDASLYATKRKECKKCFLKYKFVDYIE